MKALLAGASAVEVCSAIYSKGAAVIAEFNSFIEQWMERKGMERIESFKGLLNQKDAQGVNTFERTQFLKYFATYE